MKEIEKELNNLWSSEAAQDSNIPTKITQDNIDIVTAILLEEVDKSLALGIFPSSMELVNITPVFEKDDRTDKSNHGSIHHYFTKLVQCFWKKHLQPTAGVFW